MAKIINFEQFIQNKLHKNTNENILLSVLDHICQHMEVRPKEITDITPNSKMEDLMGGNRSRFAAAFVGLVQYWQLGSLSDEEIPFDEEFERFETVEDLCVFVEEKLKKLKIYKGKQF